MATLKSIKNKYLSASDGTVLGVATNTENISALSFKLATADSLSKFNMVDGFTDNYQDATGVDTSGSTNETRNTANKFWSGSYSTYEAFSYTGSDQTWTAPSGFSSVTVRLWGAGGASDGTRVGGGGGFVKGTLSVTAGNDYDVIVGQGGGTNGAADAYGGGGRGGTNAASGGGRTAIRTDGGSADLVTAGSGGGSGLTGNGGGGGGTTGLPGTGYLVGGGGGTQSAGGSSHGTTPGQYDGGDAYPYGSLVNAAGGGSGWYGGGAGGNRNDVHFGGGGGGSSYVTGLSATEDNLQGGSGTDATGGAGAGQGDSQWVSGVGNGGPSSDQSGEPGRVVFSWESFQNMTLVSNSYTAQTAPTTARIILDEESYAGATTLNTDLKAYASRDGGTTFTQVTLADQGQINYLAGIDQYTKLMLHCDGSDSATSFTDSSATGHTMTPTGNTHTDTTIKKFGTASAQFDGTGDYITSGASTEFSLTGDFTIDMWCYFSAVNKTIAGSLSNWDWSSASTNDWILLVDGNGYITFNVKGVGAVSSSAGHGGLNAWKHIAVERASGTSKIYVDGTLASSASTAPGSGTISVNNIVTLGRAATNLTSAYNGYIDEFRISKGIARYGAAFIPPATAYTHSRRLLAGSVDISGQPSGTSMKYKIETLNQAETKQTRVYGTSMAWA